MEWQGNRRELETSWIYSSFWEEACNDWYILETGLLVAWT